MVEVFGGRAREPTGPRRAPRTYPGPVQLQLRRAGPREDVEIASVAQLGAKEGGIESRVPFGPACVPETGLAEEGRAGAKLVARNARGAKSEITPREETDSTGKEDETEERNVGPKGRRPSTARFEDELEEPESGSHVKSEAGERNVAERRHGHPCGQQSVDEADGHRPQGAEAPRFGVHRRRRCRFRGAGFSDHRQQRSDAQSVSRPATLKEGALRTPLLNPQFSFYWQHEVLQPEL